MPTAVDGSVQAAAGFGWVHAARSICLLDATMLPRENCWDSMRPPVSRCYRSSRASGCVERTVLPRGNRWQNATYPG
jgi:hypothetical protein